MIWSAAPLKDVSKVVTGNTPPKVEADNYGDDVPWVKPPELGSTVPITDTAERLSAKGASVARVLPKDAVLVSCIGSIGRVGIAGLDLATNQQINAVICGPNLVPRFVMYWLMNSTELLSNFANNAVLPILNKGNFERIPVPIWPRSEQHRVVELLDSADRLCRLSREASAKATRILPALFLKMFGDPAINPKSWEVKPLSKVIASVEAGWSSQSEARQSQNGEKAVLKVSAVTSGIFRPEEHKAVPEVDPNRALITPRRGDLLFSRANTRELVAASCIVEADYPNLFLPDKLWRIVPFPNVAKSTFLKELFWNSGIRDKFRADSSGSSGSMLNISQNAVLRTEVPMPPLSLQEQFDQRAWSVMEIARKVQQTSLRLEHIWSELMKRAFSGQLTANWREAHMKELLAEMEVQARQLNLPMPQEEAV